MKDQLSAIIVEAQNNDEGGSLTRLILMLPMREASTCIIILYALVGILVVMFRLDFSSNLRWPYLRPRSIRIDTDVGRDM